MFKDRKDAGQLLAKQLLQYKNKKDVFVLGIPRGGVVVAHEVAKALNVPLDIIIIKKIGYPGQEELALGAVSLDGFYINEEIAFSVSKEYINEQIKIKQEEVKKRYSLFTGNKISYSLKNKTIILIDDGIATGATLIMAIQILRKQSPKKIIVAIPVAPPDTIKRLEKLVDIVVCLHEPIDFMAIGQFYSDFKQVEDEEVKRCLQ